MIIRFQADADLNHGIVVAICQTEPAISFTSAAHADLEGIPDPAILEIAAMQERILVTHDRRTMPGHFRERLKQGKSSPGIFIVRNSRHLAQLLRQSLWWEASDPEEWRNQIHHLPSLARHVFTH